MKKYIVSFAALALLLASCEKEQTIAAPEEIQLGFPQTIAAVMTDETTKTDYDASGSFAWKLNDPIRLVVTNTETSYQGWYGYSATTVADEGKTATFTADNGGADIKEFSNDTWTSTGFAIYPTSISRPQSGTEYNGYGHPFVTLRSAVSAAKSDIILVGSPKSEGSNFYFKTAMSVLKVTLNDIPAEATAVVLATDQDAYPINGDFLIMEDGSFQYTKYGSAHTGNGQLVVTLSGEETSKELYFNIPVGNCPANTLTLTVKAGDVAIYQVGIKKAMEFQRNKMYATPALTIPAGNYNATIIPGGTALALTATVTVPSGSTATSVKVVLAASEEAGTTLIDNADASVVTFADGETKDIPMTNVTTPGTYYLVGRTYAGSARKYVISQQVYAVTAADAAVFTSKYVRDMTVGSYASYLGDVNMFGDNTITLAVSDDPTKGNIMITEFAGFSYDVSENTFSTYGYNFSQFTDGRPVYGVYGDGAVYGDNTGAIFYDVANQTFYSDASSSNHIISTVESEVSYLRIGFNNDGYSSGVVHNLIVWGNYIGNCYNNSLSSWDFYFYRYVANKTKGQIPLAKAMLSTNTSYGEDGDGDAGGMAALVDKSASTYWHSNWNGSVATDEQGIYLQIAPGKALNNFTLKFLTRANITHGLPTKYRIAVSKNGTDWTFATAETTITAKANTWFEQKVSAGDDYSYIRLCITESDKGALTTTADDTYYTHMAELQLWEN